MRQASAPLLILALLILPCAAFAGFTETLPAGTWLVDIGFVMSDLNSKWDNENKRVPLIDDLKQFEPGAGIQGILKPEARAQLGVLVNQLHYGVFDNWLVGVGIPVLAYTKVDPKFNWEKGDYQWNLGRPYSEEDFWQWAGSMGQPKPEKWEGNKGVLGDIQLGLRYRFTDKSEWFRDKGLAMAVLLMGALPTGSQPDPEEVISAGTTSWDLHANGDLGIHLSMDKFFKESLDDRLTLGFEVFYEALLPHRYTSPTGEISPLMLNFRPFTGKHYTIDGGDFSGFSFQTDVVPFKGPALATWLVKGDTSQAEKLPPLLTLSLRYTFNHLQQTDWNSESPIWDWDRERLWRPGYKNILWGQMVVSLLRVGAPIQPYVAYRNLSWIPGKNARAPDVLMMGTRVLLKFW